MEILATTVYVGPNIFDKQRLIRLTIDLGSRAEAPIRDFGDALIEPLLAHIPGLAAVEIDGGRKFIDRMRADDDCYLGELLAHVALVLQKQAAAPGEIARVA
ncbi:MAG: hypothetical protein AAGJ87_17695, partial [Pseudomonadota bacterium]